MIYLFYGDDARNKFASYEKFVKFLPAGTETFSINRNNLDKDQLESLYSGAGLFFSKCVVILSGILEREENRELILGKLSQMGESGNDFIFLEGKLTKPVLDAFKKVDAKCIKINLFDLPKEKKEKFDNFLVANAFAGKDKLNLWIYFRQAMDLGVGMEELIGVLFWKIKDMLLRKNFGKFSEAELKNAASRFSYLLPEARKSGQDAEAAFEQFLLEVF